MRVTQLAGATVVVPDLDAAIAAYDELLGYRGDPPIRVGDALATAWGCAAAEARTVSLYPERGARRFIRLVEGEPSRDYRVLGSYGWSAIEIIVQDLDRLATRLHGSVFEIIGPPAVLDFDFTDKIRAMQVRGPGDAMLYLTEVSAEISGFDLPKADSFVGEIFVMVLGARSIEQAVAVYAGLGRSVGGTVMARIEVLSRAHGLPESHRHRLTTVSLEGRSLVEIDAYPETAQERVSSSIGLPSGIAMTTFTATGDVPLDGPLVIRGAADEWIELIR